MHHPFRLTAVTLWISILLLASLSAVADNNLLRPSTWVLIDTRHTTLTVMQDDEAVAYFKNISIGRKGAAPLHLLGDNTTPQGTYRISEKRTKSKYTLFFSLDYPTTEHAELALEQGYIKPVHYESILAAHARGKMPPASTPLGGAIGIHGIGKGSLSVHHQYHWTNGCVALDDKQIREFERWVSPGTRVVIR
ncbi:MAG: murein L,D-transpeptidase [Gammaproteobacteria bacterium]|nr:MAG: murein L,D-transpeptidase [Gammaproteobacteria bacterium]RLA51245.1 MAG: murein L,D-transpeptidase [Gammaproteobacteria bacterium]